MYACFSLCVAAITCMYVLADARFELQVEAKQVQVSMCDLVCASDIRCKIDASILCLP